MIASYKKRAKWGFIIWLVTFLVPIALVFFLILQIIPQAEQGQPLSLDFISSPAFKIISLLYYIAIPVSIYALYNYAKAKGYSGFFALLGILGALGFIIMASLKDKTNPATKNKSNKLVFWIVGISLFFIIAGQVANFLIDKINPLAQLSKAEVVRCSHACNEKGDNSNACIVSCVNTQVSDTTCTTQCKDSNDITVCLKDCFASTNAVWKEYADPQGKFKILFPSTPVQKTSKDGKYESVALIGTDKEFAFSLIYEDVDFLPDSTTLEKIPPLRAEKVKGEVISYQLSTFNSYPSINFKIKTKDYYYQSTAVVVGERIYVLATIGKTVSSVNFNKFLNSFQVIQP